MPTKVELTHYRLQAMLREHSFPDLEYIGERKSWKSGELEHWYRIGKAEVPVDAITELDCEPDESDTI